MDTRDWKKFAIPAVVLAVILAAAYPLLASRTDGLMGPQVSTPTMMPSNGTDGNDMSAQNTNDIIIDADADGQPEAAFTEGEAMVRDGDSDVLTDEEGMKSIALNMQNDSQQRGTATLTEVDGKVRVVLALSGGSFTAAQPAHIHVGSCPTPGAVKYPLTNVMNGRSETLLNVDMKTLMASSDTLAINIHKSAAESQVYTACGNLK